MMRDCAEASASDQLAELVHGRLDAVERVPLEAHVAACASCTAELAIVRRVHQVVTETPPVPVDVARIVAALPAPPHRGRGAGAAISLDARRSRRPQWRVAAAGALLAAGLGGVMVVQQSGAPSTAPATEQGLPSQQPTTARGPGHAEGAARDVDVQRSAASGSKSAARELAAASVTSDLSDGELASLLESMDAIEAMPLSVGEPASVDPLRLIDDGKGDE